MTTVNLEQGSQEWLLARCGKVTASRVADIMAKTKSGYSASRGNYMAELVCERLTGVPTDTFKSAAMEWGTAQEPHARAAYEAVGGVLVEEVGFVPHSSIPDAGASPDGLVGSVGLIEIKCPYTATHIETLLSGKVPDRYNTQMQWQMACTGRTWCDYVSYDPRMPENMRLFLARVFRDQSAILAMETEVLTFIHELTDKVAALKLHYGE
jgi:putative phage-type endonuclease